MQAKVKLMARRAQEASERERGWQPRRWRRQFDNTGEARQLNERTSRV
jgi:hypothetical protein